MENPMNTLSRITFIGILALALCMLPAPAVAQQNTLVETTTSAAITPSQTSFAVASATGINAPSFSSGLAGSVLYIQDVAQTAGESVIVTAITSTTVTVRRGQNGTRATGHASGAKVWVATAANWFQSVDPLGACSTTAGNAAGDKIGPYVTPVINLTNGREWVCSALTGTWVPNGDYSFYVPPTQCTFAPTTLTVTNTYPQIGASNLFVLKGISNAAAGTMTLTCNILIPTRVTATRGATLKDITLFLASSATGSGVVPTSVGTSTLGSITFPAAATTETASTVTPVAAGGTVTTTGAGATGFLTAVTTDGAFYTVKHTYGTLVTLSTDLQILQYTFPILQSAASVSTLYTPGLVVHYTAPAF